MGEIQRFFITSNSLHQPQDDLAEIKSFVYPWDGGGAHVVYVRFSDVFAHNRSKHSSIKLNLLSIALIAVISGLTCKRGERVNTAFYYPTLLRRVQISRETSTNITRYLYSSHSSRPREVQNLGKSEFWEKKSLDNKSLIRRFGV